ncbi:MAG TPA: hypothetical protein VMS77_03900 [Conexivisphaerales archaeon]|nr:hypothetical protein [Conexivisphaerales archaeon]
MAVDLGVLADWVVATLVIAVVVGLSHSFFRVGGKGMPRRAAPAPQTWSGEFVHVEVPDADSMLLYGQEALRKGDLSSCVGTAFSTAEEILLQAASTVGMPSDHTTLADLAQKLSAAGFVGLRPEELAPLDAAVAQRGTSLDGSTATKALGAAFSIRNYFMHAPIARNDGTKPIGADSGSSIQA